jgi:hypothetical protein
MILRHLKICKGCGFPKIIFSHGLCVDCANRNYKPLKRSTVQLKRSPIKRKIKPVIQDGKDLTQKEAFLVAYKACGGRWFLTGEKVAIENLTASNFAHVLNKNKFKWFKYYWKNIILLTTPQHTVYDFGSREQQNQRDIDFPLENWGELVLLIAELLLEYSEWTKTNPNTYKI